MSSLPGDEIRLSKSRIHLRSGDRREWRSFSETSQGKSATLTFDGSSNTTEHSLLIHQFDVKNTTWTVSLNGRKLGNLIADERRMKLILPVPTETLVDGKNELVITGRAGPVSDDIELSSVSIETIPVSTLLKQSRVSIDVTTNGESAPMRITIVDRTQAMAPFVSLRSNVHEAIRPGVIYSADGKAVLGLPAGEYRIYASRGFEYNAPSVSVSLANGASRSIRLALKREVTIPEYVSLDTHVHTLELSGHGDSSVDERVLTAAGEGLDFIAVTEHNKIASYDSTLDKRQLSRWITAIPGDELTTIQGHFNLFPLQPGAAVPDAREQDWTKLMASAYSAPVVIQNHPRDLHSGYRPFDESNHLSPVGENLNNRPVKANGMEVINSGAMASDPLQLVRDWMGLLTADLAIAAIGSSDTHTVDFTPIGQARTYVRAKDRRDVSGVVDGLTKGHTLASYGLAAQLEIAVNPAAHPGKTPVQVTIWGPSWAAPDSLTIFANGVPAWQERLVRNRQGGRKIFNRIDLSLPNHDATLVALVTGPGVLEPFWEVRKPYQPTSDDWKPIILGVSEAVKWDGDRDGKYTAPVNYARKLVQEHTATVDLVRSLANYDESVTMHTLHLLRKGGAAIQRADFAAAFTNGAPSVRRGYEQYRDCLTKSEAAQKRNRDLAR